MIEGQMHVLTADGLEMHLEAGHIYEILPGHDAWVVGDGPCVQYDFAGMRTFALPAAGRAERVLATLVVTDIVDSTPTAERLGPAGWATVLSNLNAECKRQIDKYRGRVGATTGDGLIAIFDGAERAIRCAAAVGAMAASQGLGLRVGVHTGEVEILNDDLRGVAVHVASRVCGVAAAGEVVVSGTTYELVQDSDLRFTDRGLHELKGVTGARQIWALAAD
jgi:class 3 adenylate cyclase